MESPPNQETNLRDAADMGWKDAKNIESARSTERWEMRRWMSMKLQEQKNSVPGNGAKKCWRCRLKWMIKRWTMNDEKSLKHQGQKNSIPGNGAKKCCRADWHDNAQTGGCHSDPRSLRLSLSPAAKGGSPCEMMRPTVDQLVGRHEIRYKKDAMDLVNWADQCLKRLM